MNSRIRFIVKGYSSFSIGLTVVTGNHAGIIGKFVSDANDADKPDGYDKEVVILEDVGFGCNVTILSGVTIDRGTTIAANAVVNIVNSIGQIRLLNMNPYCIPRKIDIQDGDRRK